MSKNKKYVSNELPCSFKFVPINSGVIKQTANNNKINFPDACAVAPIVRRKTRG